MNNVTETRAKYLQELEIFCKKNDVAFTSMQKLLEAERSKKLLKRNSLVQQNIDREIENAIADDNK
jgi:hypothetical protein